MITTNTKKNPISYGIKHVSNELTVDDSFVKNAFELCNLSESYTPPNPIEKAKARLKLFSNKLRENANDISTALVFQVLGLGAVGAVSKLNERLNEFSKGGEISQ